ncbi:MAG: hypothetical protein QXU74_01960 [Candidatus Aenigmatarchaeota archaeon]
MLNKIFGVISFLLGLLVLIFFPDIKDYQPDQIGIAGIIIGFGLIAFGIYLLKT